MGPRNFQDNLGEGEILFHLARSLPYSIWFQRIQTDLSGISVEQLRSCEWLMHRRFRRLLCQKAQRHKFTSHFLAPKTPKILNNSLDPNFKSSWKVGNVTLDFLWHGHWIFSFINFLGFGGFQLVLNLNIKVVRWRTQIELLCERISFWWYVDDKCINVHWLRIRDFCATLLTCFGYVFTCWRCIYPLTASRIWNIGQTE